MRIEYLLQKKDCICLEYKQMVQNLELYSLKNESKKYVKEMIKFNTVNYYSYRKSGSIWIRFSLESIKTLML